MPARVADVLFVLALVLVAAGLAMVYVPAGLIGAGVMLAAGAWILSPRSDR